MNGQRRVHGTRAVVLIDCHQVFRDDLARQFDELGFQTFAADDFATGQVLVRLHHPELVVCEDDLHRPWVQILRVIEESAADTRVVIATVYGSISSAVRAVREGAASYFAKPVRASQILDSLEDPIGADEAHRSYLTLSRARWEYINLTLDVSGSIAEAARRFGMARRSLRRMLSKYPPCR